MLRALAVTSLLSAAACGASSSTSAIGADTNVVGFAGTHVYFGNDNHRTVDAPVTFPAAGLRYESVTLAFDLTCPEGGCDWWDRLGHLSLVVAGADTPAPEDDVELELARFITPDRVAGSYRLDVTPLQALLVGDATLRVFIDTWVGPGHANGAGWLVDATFEFVGGAPTADPYKVVPLWSPTSVVYGDPAKPTARTVTVEIPDGVVDATLVSLITGHGQGNAGNCAEFCSKQHRYTVGDTTVSRAVWRDDCETTATPGQQGTWRYPRAGWCPGAMVAPWTEALGPLAAGPLTVGYDVEAYDNTCRPDAPTCAGCTLGTDCTYDGGAHTEPRYEQSALLVLYR